MESFASSADTQSMTRTKCLPLVLALALFAGRTAELVAGDHATAVDARIMLQKAVAYYKLVGRKRALADFTAQRPPFRDRDLYVVCFDSEGIIVANGGFSQNVDTKVDTLLDTNGKGVGTAAREALDASGEATIHYRWLNPTTHRLESKSTLFARAGSDVCGVGTYDPR